MTSSFEKPKTNASFLSISVTRTLSATVSDSRVASSRPANPAPRITTRRWLGVTVGEATPLTPATSRSRALTAADPFRRAAEELLQVLCFASGEVLEPAGHINLEGVAVERVPDPVDELPDIDPWDLVRERIVARDAEKLGVDYTRVDNEHLDAGLPEIDGQRLGEHRQRRLRCV